MKTSFKVLAVQINTTLRYVIVMDELFHSRSTLTRAPALMGLLFRAGPT